MAVGGWNVQIFSPDWIKKNVCDDHDCTIELALPFNFPTAQPRFSFEGVYLFVNPSRLELRPQNLEIENFSKCLKFIKKILSVLSHTPINSFGINFTFESDGDHADIIDKFIFSDNASFNAEIYQLTSTKIQRSFKLTDGTILNLSISIDGDIVIVSFNYHREVLCATECAGLMNEDLIANFSKDSLELLEQVYNIHINEGEI